MDNNALSITFGLQGMLKAAMADNVDVRYRVSSSFQLSDTVYKPTFIDFANIPKYRYMTRTFLHQDIIKPEQQTDDSSANISERTMKIDIMNVRICIFVGFIIQFHIIYVYLIETIG